MLCTHRHICSSDEAANERVTISSRYRSALNVGIGPASRGANQLVALGLTLVAIRFLDPTQFGVFALASIAITIIRTLLYSGTFEHLLKAESATGESTEALVSNLALVAVLSAFAAGLALSLRAFGQGQEIALLLLVLIPSNFVAAFGAWQEALLLRSGRLTAYYLLTFVAELLSTLAAVAMFVTGYGLMALVAQIYLRNGLICLFYLLLQRPVLSDRFSAKVLRQVLGWSVPRYGSVMLNMSSTFSVDLLLGAFLSPAATGVYRASNRIVTAVADVFNQPTRMISLSMVSKRVSAGRSASALWTLIFALAASVGLAALAGLASVAGLLVPALMGDEWALAAPIVAILCIARAFTLLDAAMTPALVAHDRQHALFRVHLVTATSLVALVLLIVPYGVVAVAWTVAGVAAVNSLLGLMLAHRHLPGAGASLAKVLAVALLPAVAVAVGAGSASSVLNSAGGAPILSLVLAIAVGIGAWMLSFALLIPKVRGIVKQLRAQDETDGPPSVGSRPSA